MDNRIKVALLSDSSSQYLSRSIKAKLEETDFNYDLFCSGFGELELELGSGDSQYHGFHADYTVIINSSEVLKDDFSNLPYSSKRSFAENKLEQIVHKWSLVPCGEVLQSNFVFIPDNLFGVKSPVIVESFEYQIRKLNYLMTEKAIEFGITLIDINMLQNLVGRDNFFNLKQYYLGKFSISSKYSDHVAELIHKKILLDSGKVIKCVVLDLDNTLWGGVIGDDGLEGIKIGQNMIGKIYSDIQCYFKQLKERGIILCVCSKNEMKNAREVFEKHPEMILKLDDISVFIANWNDKATNIKYIQETLNIGFDSMIFIDDNEFERELVKSMIPEITVPSLPSDPSEYLKYLIEANYFSVNSFEKEDSSRTLMYQAEAKRRNESVKYESVEKYLQSLEMISHYSDMNKFTIGRVEQLLQRSNQFNLTTKRYSKQELNHLVKESKNRVLTFDLSDKFGKHGIISVLVLKITTDEIYIDSFVMSCRVLKRGMENLILDTLVNIANELNIDYIKGEFIESKKNKIVKDLYESLGFEGKEAGIFVLDVNKYCKQKYFIEPRKD